MGSNGAADVPEKIHGLCPGCGNYFVVLPENINKQPACQFCGKPIELEQHTNYALPPVDAETEKASVDASAARSGGHPIGADIAEAAESGQYVATPAIRIPSTWHEAATQDPEAAMLARAWEAFNELEWPCQNWPAQKAFSVVASVKGPRDKNESLNVTVFAYDGLITMETVVAPLPNPPLTDLRDLLCRINVRSGGSVFMLRDCGVVARYKMLPRKRHNQNFSKEGVVRGLRQLNKDRLITIPLLKPEAVRMTLADPSGINQAFSQPLAGAVSSHLSPKQLQSLAEKAGYRARAKGAMLYLAKQNSPANAFPIWFSISNGVMKGWTVPGGETGKREATGIWGMFTKAVSTKKSDTIKLNRPQLDSLLKKLDGLNESSGLLNYVWNGKQIMAMAVFPPTEKRMEPEELKHLADALFWQSEKSLRGQDGLPLM